MKRFLIIMLCMAAMVVASLSAKAQEVTITLFPGWNWISYPNAEVMDINTALGDFVPMNGDIIHSQYGSSAYVNGYWRGGVTHFMPGWGYMYYSNRTEIVSFVFGEPAPQLTVTTAEPTNITMASATCGGNVVSSNGDYVDVILRGICWSYSPNPTFNDNYIEAGNGLGSFTIPMSDLPPSTTYYVRAFAVAGTETYYGEEFSFTTLDHDRVDLGLPSGTLWATCNIGAYADWARGSYFSWGETEPKEYYHWDSYQYCDGSETTLTKYCNDASYGYNGFTDNLSTLQPCDDAATAIWGTDWHTPTQEEWQELLDNTIHTWTTSNGVNGFVFRASNGNKIFLPVTGIRSSSSLLVDYIGCYWSSSLGTDYPSNARNLNFYSQDCSVTNTSRYCGIAVRPVRSAPQNTFFMIDATANPIVGGEISGAGTYQEGAECTLTATANEGYTFTNWTENDSVVSTDSIYTFIVTGARNLVANFEAIPTVNVYAWVSTKKIIADDITPELVISKKFVQVPDTSTGLTYGMEIPEGAVSASGRILAAIPKLFTHGSTTSDGTFFTVPTNLGDGVNNIGIFTSKEITLNGTQYIVVESTAQTFLGYSFAVVFGDVKGSSWNAIWSDTSSRRIDCEVYTNGVLVYPESRTDTQ